jgi:hypothetical protein
MRPAARIYHASIRRTPTEELKSIQAVRVSYIKAVKALERASIPAESSSPNPQLRVGKLVAIVPIHYVIALHTVVAVV